MQRDPEKSQNEKEQLEEYQRKFRNLESDRKSFAQETVAIIKKQRGMIDKLKNENYQLKGVISKMNENKMQSQTSYGVRPDSIEEIKLKIEKEQDQRVQIQNHLKDFQDKIIKKRQTIGGYNAGQETESSLSKQIKILENRLDKANQKFNEAIAINKQLRQQIDSLRRERVIFDNLYKKLEKELHEKRKNMADIIESANSAYEERDKANDEIQNAKSQAKRESADFEKDLRELSHTMEKNKKKHDYQKHIDFNREDNMGDNMAESDKFTKTKNQKMLKDKNLNSNIQEQIQKYEEDFAKIQAATKVTDFDKLVDIFKQNEMNNFDMFKYVNELSNDIEELDKSNQELQKEIDQYSGPGNQVDILNKKKLKELEEKLSRAENKSEQFEFKYHDAIKLIGNLTNWIETLFTTIDCDKGFAKELAGSHGVTEGNMMIYLGIVEERVSQILQAYAGIKAENENYQSVLSNATKQINDIGTTGRHKQEIPTMGDDYADEDQDGDKIYTLEDFRKKAKEYIAEQKKNGDKQKGGKKQQPKIKKKM